MGIRVDLQALGRGVVKGRGWEGDSSNSSSIKLAPPRRQRDNNINTKNSCPNDKQETNKGDGESEASLLNLPLNHNSTPQLPLPCPPAPFTAPSSGLHLSPLPPPAPLCQSKLTLKSVRATKCFCFN